MNTPHQQYTLANYQRPTDVASPNGDKRILMHSCCAPCASEVMLALQASGYEQTIFFYNPNIHPHKEYTIRKEENMRYCDKLNIPFIDADYDRIEWFDRTKGMEWEPERGKRCTSCFDMRFERTAEHAKNQGWSLISSTLGISRWKDMDQINDCGTRAAAHYEGMEYWTLNWRKQGGSLRMIEISKQEQFYQQEYCGCVYSLRDTNRWREERGRERVVRGVKFYTQDGLND